MHLLQHHRVLGLSYPGLLTLCLPVTSSSHYNLRLFGFGPQAFCSEELLSQQRENHMQVAWLPLGLRREEGWPYHRAENPGVRDSVQEEPVVSTCHQSTAPHGIFGVASARNSWFSRNKHLSRKKKSPSLKLFRILLYQVSFTYPSYTIRYTLVPCFVKESYNLHTHIIRICNCMNDCSVTFTRIITWSINK